VVVAGGSGFIGSHLCEALLARGHRVLDLDDHSTGRVSNVAHLRDNDRFVLLEGDVTDEDIEGRVAAVIGRNKKDKKTKRSKRTKNKKK